MVDDKETAKYQSKNKGASKAGNFECSCLPADPQQNHTAAKCFLDCYPL